MPALVLGPLLRHVGERAAAVWVETDAPATVRVVAADPETDRTHTAAARTFAVHGHHYALVSLDDLEPGRRYPYTVELDDVRVWPEPESTLPPSVIPTLDLDKPLRLAYGSCRTSVSHDASGNRTHGVDALRAYALRMAGLVDESAETDPDRPRWPDLVLFLGDQVYADETNERMREFIAARRDIDQPPWTELRDYEEYAHLYWLGWSEPVNRWLLSTLPSLMIFDDHDIRDDWNTSRAWKDAMEATSWWHDRIVGGLAAYWVYQHLGNLTPAEREEDQVWQTIQRDNAAAEPGAYDAGPMLDAFADRADQDPRAYRWSFVRDLGGQARLVVIDSRAARVLEPGQRSILDALEMDWLDEQMRGDVDHLLVGTSLPFLLAPGLHYVEAFSESLAGGAWGKWAARLGEWIRTTVDLEHWAAFQQGFLDVARMVLEVARGQRGRAPATVTFLSGDVHHSYLSEAQPARHQNRTEGPVQSRILQAVCSPIRNPLPRHWRFATAFASYGLAKPVGYLAARSAKVPDAPLRWRLIRGPWFDNVLGTLEVTDAGLRLWWATGRVDNKRHDRPRLAEVADVSIRRDGRPAPVRKPVLRARVAAFAERRRERRAADPAATRTGWAIERVDSLRHRIPTDRSWG